MERLGDGFLRGRILSSDTFVTGRDLKIRLGEIFGCRICEMEAGAMAYVSMVYSKPPWLQIRTVADALDDNLAAYFKMEKDIAFILGEKVLRVLQVLAKEWRDLAG
jgi:nucleoside phosphorylase